jgi:hypothetical protein
MEGAWLWTLGHGERSLLDQTGLLTQPNHLHKRRVRYKYASRTGRHAVLINFLYY